MDHDRPRLLFSELRVLQAKEEMLTLQLEKQRRVFEGLRQSFAATTGETGTGEATPGPSEDQEE